MSEENLEVVRQMLLAFRKGDVAVVMRDVAQLLDPEIEMDTTRAPMPGLAGIYKGPAEVARFWSGWGDAWGSLGEFEDPELIDAGDQVFAWFHRHEMRGKGSGIEVDMPGYGWVYSIRNRRFVRGTFYLDRASALEAAGLSE
jgi:ketosteroid isomerase-like protein